MLPKSFHAFKCLPPTDYSTPRGAGRQGQPRSTEKSEVISDCVQSQAKTC